jgi:hypothetical protein
VIKYWKNESTTGMTKLHTQPFKTTDLCEKCKTSILYILKDKLSSKK